MHRTRSLDYAIILSGEIDMMLDDGDVHLKPGDVIVQQATNHAWVNRGKEPCRRLLISADHRRVAVCCTAYLGYWQRSGRAGTQQRCLLLGQAFERSGP